jgi:hypothetical protein
MNASLLKACAALVPSSVLLIYSTAVFTRYRTVPALLQLSGATCLLLVVLTHIAEALRLFPAMHFGAPDSVGHYFDLTSAVLAVTLLPGGFVLHRRDTASRRLRASHRGR